MGGRNEWPEVNRRRCRYFFGRGLDCRLNGQQNSVKFGRQCKEGQKKGETRDDVVMVYERAASKKREFGTIGVINLEGGGIN